MALPADAGKSATPTCSTPPCGRTFEETGVRLKRTACLAALDDLQPRARSIPRVLIRPHVFELDRKPRVRTSCEVAGILWAPLSRLQRSRAAIRVPERKAPCDAFLLGPHVVWGITYRILRAFLNKSRKPA